jgi:hypothetical protein
MIACGIPLAFRGQFTVFIEILAFDSEHAENPVLGKII